MTDPLIGSGFESIFFFQKKDKNRSNRRLWNLFSSFKTNTRTDLIIGSSLVFLLFKNYNRYNDRYKSALTISIITSITDMIQLESMDRLFSEFQITMITMTTLQTTMITMTTQWSKWQRYTSYHLWGGVSLSIVISLFLFYLSIIISLFLFYYQICDGRLLSWPVFNTVLG